METFKQYVDRQLKNQSKTTTESDALAVLGRNFFQELIRGIKPLFLVYISFNLDRDIVYNLLMVLCSPLLFIPLLCMQTLFIRREAHKEMLSQYNHEPIKY